MMRSMYSAVSGLKTHQTRMDVIGNNIANVNTVAFKSSSVTFSDILYQTTSNASGANATTGTGGVNAKQIGLGTTAAATKVSITSAGASETTGNPFDIRLTDKNSTNFFIVNNGSENVFTRSGSFYVDGSGNLCMSSTGYTVMGWQVDETTGEIRKDTVSALRIMQEKNLTSAPEATTQATIAGVLDENDTDVKNDAGRVMNLNFYDNLGYQYTAKFAIKSTGTDGKYTVELTSVLDSNNKNIIADLDKQQIAQIFGNYNANATLGQYGLTKDYTYDKADQTYVDSTGKKFGKSEGNAVWLDATKTTPYEMYQFWLNVMDDDAVRFLKIFTFLSLEEIEEIGKEFDQARHQRLAQKVLAREVVTLVHGKEAYEQAVHITEQLFAGNLKALSARDLKVALNGVPTYEISADENLNIVELLVNAKISPSKRQAREDVQNGAIYINGERVQDLDYTLSDTDKIDNEITVIRRGKKKNFVLTY